MNLKAMELKLYEEYKRKVEMGEYNSKVVYEELKKGDYLLDMQCRKSDEKSFDRVYKVVKTEMLDGFIAETNRAPFFVREPLKKVKYGESLYMVNINKNILKSVSKKIDEIKKSIGNDSFISNLSRNKVKINNFSTKMM